MIRPSAEMRFQAMQACRHPLESFTGEAVQADVGRLIMGSANYVFYSPHANVGHNELTDNAMVLAQAVANTLPYIGPPAKAYCADWDLRGNFETDIIYQIAKKPSLTLATIVRGRCRVSLTEASAELPKGYVDDISTFSEHQQIMRETWRMTRIDPNIASTVLHQADMGPGSSLLFVSSRGDMGAPQGMWHNFVPLSADAQIIGHTITTVPEVRKNDE